MAEVALPLCYGVAVGMEQSPATGIDWSKFNDEIQLPLCEDFESKSEDEEEEEEMESGFGSIIVVDNLPVVEPAKFERLEGMVRKIFGHMGTFRTLYMPKDKETGRTLGYAFIEYSTPQEAQAAREQTDSYKLGNFVFVVRMFDDIDRFLKVPKQWAPPELKSYVPGENLLEWLIDGKGRDQFVIRSGSETEVCWNDARLLNAETACNRSFWTESFAQWSPLGTYLATIHRQGAVLWGGCTKFTQITRFIHREVRLIDFSPGERFLVTYSSHEPSNPRETQKVILNVFDVRSGKSLREFRGSADEYAGGVAGVSWPVFRWSGDDKYFARIGKQCISVYETETMGLLDKKSLKVENVKDLSWSPTDSILALFVPEGKSGNQPAKVSLVQIPSREELRQKNLFSVSDCNLYWQSNGDYLAVKVDRYTKAKKSTNTSFELFRIKERDIPIEVLELENKNHKVIAFAWEPKGHRFAIIHGDGPRPDVSFYSMTSPNNVDRVTKLTTLKGKQADALYWSPAGRFIVLAGLKSYNGQLEFYNVDDLETMATAEHFMATDVDWDPAGRYVTTSVTSVHQMENGFVMWSFHGKFMYKVPRDRLFQFLWRPRPPSLLSSEEEAEIFGKLRSYSKRYEQEDMESSRLHSTQEVEQRRKLVEEWNEWLATWKSMKEPSDDEQEYEDEEVEIEEILNVQEIKEEDLREIFPP